MPVSRRKPLKKSKSKPKPRKQTPVAIEEETWWSINKIVDERRGRRGQTEYLVDWVDDPNTGESFDPTWSYEVTEEALQEWISRNKVSELEESQPSPEAPSPHQPPPAVVTTPTERSQDLHEIQREQSASSTAEPEVDETHTGQELQKQNTDTQATLASVEHSPGSQPPQPAHRRRIQRADASTTPNLTRQRLDSSFLDPDERPRKAPRLVYSQSPSEEPVPSVTSLETAADSVEDIAREAIAFVHTSRFTVQIPEPHCFDASEYLSIANTQSTGHSSQTIAEHEEAAERIAIPLSSTQQTGRTIPDSQEPSGQSLLGAYIDDKRVSPNHDFTFPSSPELSQNNQDFPPSSHSHAHPPNSSEPAPAQSSADILISCSIPSNRIEDSAGPEASNIPSHQPNLSVPVSEGALVINSSPEAASSTSSILEPPRSTVSNRVDRLGLGFLTQPSVQHTFRVPESSFGSQILESPIYAAIRNSPSQGSPLVEACGPQKPQGRESQPAQIVTQDSHYSVAEFTSNSIAQGARSKSCQISHTGYSSSSLHHLTSTRMERLSPEESERPMSMAPATQLSAVDELSQLFGLSPATDRPRDTSISREKQPSPESLPAHRLGSENGLDIPLPLSTVPPVTMGPPSSSPPPPMASNPMIQPQLSVADSARDIVSLDFGSSEDHVSTAFIGDPSQLIPGGTVSPADISRQVTALPLMPSLLAQNIAPSNIFENSIDSPEIAVEMPQGSNSQPDNSLSIAATLAKTEHLITLPFQASLRPLYDDILLKNRRHLTKFGESFSHEIFEAPNAALVDRIDHVFGLLHNVCDYPPDAVGTALEDLAPHQQAKYCCDTNPKFSFVYEFLNGLKRETKVLIVARSPYLLELLCQLADMANVAYTCLGIKKANFSVIQVTLALPSEPVDTSGFDVIIGFDHAFAQSHVARSLEPRSPQGQSGLAPSKPLVLLLITTHSIEHIDLQIPEEMTGLERMNVLLSGIVRARQLVRDPEQEYPEPHEAAEMFFDLLNGETDVTLWEAVSLPEEVLDVYRSSQAMTQLPGDKDGGSKRKFFDDSDSDVNDGKRIRVLPSVESTVETNEPPLPDNVSALLDAAMPTESKTRPSKILVKVPLVALEEIANQNAELARQIAASSVDDYKALITTLERRIKDHERTTAKIYASHRTTLEDSAKFRTDKRKAERALQTANEDAQRDNEKAQKRLADLEAAIARLTADPDVARQEKILREAQDRVQSLEKRLENAHKDGEYTRSLYQDSTTTVSVVRAENNELKEENARLQKQASANMVKIHEIQAATTARENRREIEELKMQARERERELNQVRDELRQVKSGRRETRQVSVPRSPRMGMMSPRPARGYGGPGSRGPSPGPTGLEGMPGVTGAQYVASAQQPPSRWQSS